MRRNKLEEVEKFAKELGREFPTANFGGCCVVASLAAPLLAKHFRDVSIRVKGDPWSDREAIKNTNVTEVANNVRDANGSALPWNRNGVEFYHVYVQFKYRRQLVKFEAGYCGKSESEPVVYPGELPVEHANKLAANYRNWNRAFDRAQIPKLSVRINEFFAAL